MSALKLALAALAFLLVAPLSTAQLIPKIVLDHENFGCPLKDLNGGKLVETQPGPFAIFCNYKPSLLCGYSTDFGGGSAVAGCPPTGFLKELGCVPAPRQPGFPLACPIVGPEQVLLTHGHGCDDLGIACYYNGTATCRYSAQTHEVLPGSTNGCPAKTVLAHGCPKHRHKGSSKSH